MEHWTRKLVELDACSEAIEWVRTQPSLEAAWAVCTRGDWMAWLAGRCSGKSESPERKVLVLALCEILRGALHTIPAEEVQPHEAIETVEAWARGQATIEAVKSAAVSAVSYAVSHAAASAVYAVSAVSYTVSHAAAKAANAANAAVSYAVSYAAAKAAKAAVVSADIMRKHYPQPPRIP